MSKETINTGLWSVLRGRINANFTELYSRGFVNIENYVLDTDPDYTLAFQRAVDDLPESTGFEAGGGTIYLEGKDYVISSTIVIEKSIQIIGVGSDAGTRIYLADNSDCNMFEIGKRDSSDPISVTLQGLRIEMSLTQASGYSNVVLYNYIRHSHFNDLFIAHSTNYNFYMLNDGGYSKPHNNYFYGCAFEYADVGAVKVEHDYNLNFNSCYFGFGTVGENTIGLDIQMTAENLVISNCWWLPYNNSQSLKIYGAYHTRIVNNCFGGNESVVVAGSADIDLTSCDNTNIMGNIMEGWEHTYSIRSNADNTNVRVYDNIFTGYGTAPYYFSDKSVVYCANNTMKSSTMQSSIGIDTIPDGATYVDVSHNIFTTPESVIATPQGNESIWIDTIGSATFRINRSGSSGDLVCHWNAGVKTY